MARFFVSSKLSENMSVTPEGYLLCIGVPIARTGSLEYLPDEVGIPAVGDKDTVTVYRWPDDLLSSAAMASFEGKPFCADHPDEDVTVHNWHDYAAGHAQNIRRGVGAETDLMLADLLITDKAVIALILDEGLREISCGYDADYVAVAPGVARQTNIVGNHIALVYAGRCGSRCAIRDKDTTMSKPKKGGLLQAIFGSPAIKRTIDSDPEASKALTEAIMEAVNGGDTNVVQPAAATDAADPQPAPASPATDNDPAPVKPSAQDADQQAEILLLLRSILEKLDASANGAPVPPQNASDAEIEAADVKDADPTQDEDPKPQTKDSALRRTVDSATIQKVALVAPGLSVRTGDNALVARRAALQMAHNPEIRRTIDAVLGGVSARDASPDCVNAAFAAAAEVGRMHTNTRTVDALTRQPAAVQGAGDTPASLNTMFAEHRKIMGAK